MLDGQPDPAATATETPADSTPAATTTPTSPGVTPEPETLPGGAAEDTVNAPTEEISGSILDQEIAEADWIIFNMLDVDPVRYPSSDAVKRFLRERGAELEGKQVIVLALSAPYFLDATEISNLSAYLGVYAKSQPFLENAVRVLFRSYPPTGAPPVSVAGTLRRPERTSASRSPAHIAHRHLCRRNSAQRQCRRVRAAGGGGCGQFHPVCRSAPSPIATTTWSGRHDRRIPGDLRRRRTGAQRAAGRDPLRLRRARFRWPAPGPCASWPPAAKPRPSRRAW
ncbi:MAG: hypothetical protein R3A10_04925 [Caldilineaceae bacterium]